MSAFTHIAAFAAGGAVVYLYPQVAERGAAMFRRLRGLFRK